MRATTERMLAGWHTSSAKANARTMPGRLRSQAMSNFDLYPENISATPSSIPSLRACALSDTGGGGKRKPPPVHRKRRLREPVKIHRRRRNCITRAVVPSVRLYKHSFSGFLATRPMSAGAAIATSATLPRGKSICRRGRETHFPFRADATIIANNQTHGREQSTEEAEALSADAIPARRPPGLSQPGVCLMAT